MTAPMCPRCLEHRLTEVVTTKLRRVAFCSVCSHAWAYEEDVCRCDVVPVPHMHETVYPACPQCGKPARETGPQ